MPFLLRATPRQGLAGRSVRSEANLTVAGHSRDTPGQAPDATDTRLVVASHPPSGQSARLTETRRVWYAGWEMQCRHRASQSAARRRSAGEVDDTGRVRQQAVMVRQ